MTFTDRAGLGLLLALILVAPWPIGGRIPWVAMALAIGATAIGTWWLADALVRGRDLVVTPLYAAIAAFLGLAAVQWAAGWTVYAHATAYEWVRLYSYALVFVVTLHLARRRANAERLVAAITLSAAAVSFFALAQASSWNGLMFWFYDPPYDGRPYGPFNNGNYFPGLMVPAIAPGLALLLGGGLRRGRILTAFATTLGILAILGGFSRGGMIALAGMVLAVVLLVTKGREATGSASRLAGVRRAAVGAVALGVVATLALGALGRLDGVLERLGTLARPGEQTSVTVRIELWQSTVDMFLERPLTGFGLNTYGWVLPAYRTELTSDYVMQAHNEYLETLAETGAIGGLFALAFVLLLFREGWRRLRESRGHWEPCLRAGALAAWAGVLVYALTDFPTIIPAIDYLLATLAGLAIAPVTDRRSLAARGADSRAGRRRARRDARRLEPGRTPWRIRLGRLLAPPPPGPPKKRRRRRRERAREAEARGPEIRSRRDKPTPDGDDTEMRAGKRDDPQPRRRPARGSRQQPHPLADEDGES